MTANERVDDPWVHPKACERKHEELDTLHTAQYSAIIKSLNQLIVEQAALSKRLYIDNGHKSVQTVQSEHQLAIEAIKSTLKTTNDCLTRVIWGVIGIVATAVFGGIVTLVIVAVKHFVLAGQL